MIGAIALWQWRDKRWISRRFQPSEVVIVSFGVTFYGRESDPGRLKTYTGVLLLLKSGLLIRTRFRGKEFKIPKEAIRSVYVGKNHKGKKLYQYVMKIDFTNRQGELDSSAFRVPYPKQWMAAIERTLEIKPIMDIPEGE